MKHLLMLLLASAPFACMANGTRGLQPANAPTMHGYAVTTLSSTSDDDDKVYDYNAVEKQPRYPGGNTAFLSDISKNLRYPEEAAKKNIEGTAMVAFIIEKDGRILDAKVINDVHPLLKEEAIRTVKSLRKFKPGKHNGKPVRVGFYLPVKFHQH